MSVIRTLASTENPLFSQASMSVAAAASSRPASLNHRITRRRTRAVSAARSAWVIDRAGRNAGGVSPPARSAAGMKTPSVTHAWGCTWWLSAEPKRCRKEMPPSLGREALGVSAVAVTPEAVIRVRSISLLGHPLKRAWPRGPDRAGADTPDSLLRPGECFEGLAREDVMVEAQLLADPPVPPDEVQLAFDPPHRRVVHPQIVFG